MKTNVSIKFNSIEEYREIEKKLEELGYVNDKDWNNGQIYDFDKFFHHYNMQHFVRIEYDEDNYIFSVFTYCVGKTYNSLEEFLKD